METGNPELTVNSGATHGALAMTTAGDLSTICKEEVKHLMGGGSP
jgi:hypothetical protein